jgi:hypothetical protein
VAVLGLLLPAGQRRFRWSGPSVRWPIHADGLWQFATILAKVLSIGTVALVLFGVGAPARDGGGHAAPGPPRPARRHDPVQLPRHPRDRHRLWTPCAPPPACAGCGGPTGRPALPPDVATTAALVGSLFVTSHARAEQTHRAMTLRGYSGARPTTAADPPTVVATGSLSPDQLAAAAALVALEFSATGRIV